MSKVLHVLVASNDAQLRDQLAGRVRAGTAAIELRALESDALLRQLSGAADAIVLHARLQDPAKDLESVAQVAQHAEHAAVIVVTARPDASFEREAVRRGAQDCLPYAALQGDLLPRSLLLAVERARGVAALSRANRGLRDFAHVVAHELRSPLTAVLASLDLVMRLYGRDLAPDARECVEQSREGAREIAGLVTHLLAFVEASESADVGPQDCNLVLSRACRALDRLDAGAAARVSSDPLPALVANPAVLQLIFQNLLAAALDPPGEGRAHVSCRESQGRIEFAIAHRGPGGPPAEVDGQLQYVAGHRAAGERVRLVIGLTFSRDCVEGMGGRVWIESSPDGQWEFKLSLPSPGRA